MIPDRIAALVLASGESRRFGTGNKLLAPLRGCPLATYSVEAIRGAGFAHSFAVVPAQDAKLAALYREEGVTVIANDAPETGQGASLALGTAAVAETGAEGMLVLLADMPFVTQTDLFALCGKIGTADAAASEVEGRLMPPVLFRRELFPALSKLTGDRGGRNILRQLTNVTAVPLSEQATMDLDTQGDFTRAESAL